MPPLNAEKAAPAIAQGDPLKSDRLGGAIDTRHSKWRDKFKVHPAADIFPMMDDDDLATLGEDIERTGLKHQIILTCDGQTVLDGRNRLEAMERAGIPLNPTLHLRNYGNGDQIALVISSNIRRRHLTKEQQADLIVAALKASRQVGEVPKQRHVKGNAGSEKDAEKEQAVAVAKEYGISKRTVERAIAKTVPKNTEPKPIKPIKAAKSGSPATGLAAMREGYAVELAKLGMSDVVAEIDRLKSRVGELKAITAPKAAAQPEPYPDLPEFLDRRRK